MTSAPDDLAIQHLCEQLALDAGRGIMDVFDAGFAIEQKEDASPVTAADRMAEAIILDGLRAAFPDIPCVAEEEAAAGSAPQDPGEEFFLIDPLDGTREFIRRSGDFTVNIALVRNGTPQVGVVFAPCSRRCFSARPGLAESLDLDGAGNIVARRRIRVRPEASPITIVASRSHRTPDTDDFIRGIEAAEIISVGSSLKFCLIAGGEADLYPRFGRTMEWDTAAGDAVLRAAGGMTRTLDGKPLTYGKRGQLHDADFANPFFIARGAGDAPAA